MIIDVDEDFLEHFGVKGMKWGVRKKREPAKYPKLPIDKNDHPVTKQTKKEFNSMSDKEFFQKHAVTKKVYAKRVAKYGDPYRGSRVARAEQKTQARVNARAAKKDKKWEENATSFKNQLEVYNRTADRMNNGGLDSLNNNPRFKDKDLTKNKALMDAYNKEHERIWVREYKASAKSMGTNFTGTKEIKAVVRGNNLELVVVDVKHSDENPLRFRLVRDLRGFIVEVISEQTSLAQMSMRVSAFLQHYGITPNI